MNSENQYCQFLQRRTVSQIHCVCLLCLFLFACSGANPNQKSAHVTASCHTGSNGNPDWLETGLSQRCYPETEYVTGFAVATGENALDKAKNKARADLASRISVRIEHELSDISKERDGSSSYYVASVTRATSDVQLRGLDYETFHQKDRFYALAVLNRASGAEQCRHRRREGIKKLRNCIESARRLMKAKDTSRALESYQTCRLHVVEALEQDSIARVLSKANVRDDEEHAELVSTSQLIKDQTGEILNKTAGSLNDATDSLALQLVNQGVSMKSRWIFAPLTYGITNFSSPFGHKVSLDLEAALSRYGALFGSSKTRESADLVAKGIFVEEGSFIHVTITVKEVKRGRLIASAETSILKSSLPSSLDVVPRNFEDALAAQRLLAEGELVEGSLRLEIWADKGNRGVVYTESEEMKLFLRVNQPCYVRIIYVLESGFQVVVEQSYFLDASKVNMAVEYPYTFEVVPPFGIEHVHATAFTKAPSPLQTKNRLVDGVTYEVVANGLKSVVRHRGIRKKKIENQVSESILSITTMPQ